MDKIKQKVLEELIAEMDGREMNGLKSGMSKVEVMAEEPEELAEGLSMAEKMVKSAPESMDQEESFESDETKSPVDMDPEMIKKLMEMYSQLK